MILETNKYWNEINCQGFYMRFWASSYSWSTNIHCSNALYQTATIYCISTMRCKNGTKLKAKYMCYSYNDKRSVGEFLEMAKQFGMWGSSIFCHAWKIREEDQLVFPWNLKRKSTTSRAACHIFVAIAHIMLIKCTCCVVLQEKS